MSEEGLPGAREHVADDLATSGGNHRLDTVITTYVIRLHRLDTVTVIYHQLNG